MKQHRSDFQKCFKRSEEKLLKTSLEIWINYQKTSKLVFSLCVLFWYSKFLPLTCSFPAAYHLVSCQFSVTFLPFRFFLCCPFSPFILIISLLYVFLFLYNLSSILLFVHVCMVLLSSFPQFFSSFAFFYVPMVASHLHTTFHFFYVYLCCLQNCQFS